MSAPIAFFLRLYFQSEFSSDHVKQAFSRFFELKANIGSRELRRVILSTQQ
jgi:hypothetical protein